MKRQWGLGLLGLMLLLPSCGYRLAGGGRNIPEDVRLVAIPEFTNRSTRFEAERFFTQAIREAFLSRTRLKLVSEVSYAKAVLEGSIDSLQVKPISFSAYGAAHLYRVTVVVSVRWVDQIRNKVLAEKSKITFEGEYDTDQGDFMNQESLALRKVAKDTAETVVATVLDAY